MAWIAVLGVLFVGFVLFVIYYLFKVVEFTLVSVNLYRKMVSRQDVMVKILLDIRDQAKSVDPKVTLAQIEEESQSDDSESYDSSVGVIGSAADGEALEFCYHCGAELEAHAAVCPKCGKRL